MEKKYIIGLALIATIIATIFATPALAATGFSQTGGMKYMDMDRNRVRDRDMVCRAGVEISIFNASITSVTNNSITVESEEYTGELYTAGMWIYINDSSIGYGRWVKVMNLVSEGKALVAMVTIEKGDVEKHILLGLKQGDNTLLRPKLFKKIHLKSYIGLECTLNGMKNGYMILDRKGHKMLMPMKPGGKWYRAGEGEGTWSDFKDEFNEGDTLKIFSHNILILRRPFRTHFGIDAIILGHGRTIIDLTTGCTITEL